MNKLTNKDAKILYQMYRGITNTKILSKNFIVVNLTKIDKLFFVKIVKKIKNLYIFFKILAKM